MTLQIKEIKRVLFSGEKSNLRIYNTKNGKSAYYTFTKTDTHQRSFYVWGKEATKSKYVYVGQVYWHRPNIIQTEKSISKDSTVYNMIKFFLMILFDEYPWMEEIGLVMHSTCACCGHSKTIEVEGKLSEEK